jgi:2-dehydro-3-deoxyglucarate aldolase
MLLKKKIKNNQLTIGSWIMIPDAVSVEVMALAGFEWLVVDLEHTSIDLHTAENLIRTIQANKMSALIRVSKNEEVAIKKALDMGSDGIIVPMVCSEEDALNAVNFAKYPPQGKRGVGLYRASGYGTKFEEYKKWVNNELVIIAQIEHKNSVNNLEKIIKVNGIDGILIGPYDLSGSMGYPGNFDKSDFKIMIKKILDTCRKHKFPAGFHMVDTDPAKLQLKIDQGYTFLAYGIDYCFLRDCSKKGMNIIKNRLLK